MVLILNLGRKIKILLKKNICRDDNLYVSDKAYDKFRAYIIRIISYFLM